MTTIPPEQRVASIENKTTTETLKTSRHSEDKIRSLMNDFNGLRFSNEIKQKANEIYMKMRCPTKRSKKRKLLIFYCIYCAHEEMGIVKNPYEIAYQVGIPISEIPKAMTLFSCINTGYNPPDIKKSPMHYLPDYCRRLGFDDNTKEMIIEMINKIIEKDKTLLDEAPQKFLAGVLKSFMTFNGIEYNKEYFSMLFVYSDVTLNNITKKIINIYSNL